MYVRITKILKSIKNVLIYKKSILQYYFYNLNMNILGFNTSTEKFSLAISKNNQIVYYI